MCVNEVQHIPDQLSWSGIFCIFALNLKVFMELKRITRKQAEELEALGFPFEYASSGFHINSTNSFYSYLKGELCELPYFELVVKWLRTEKGIHLEVVRYADDIIKSVEEYTFRIYGIYQWPFATNDYDTALSDGINKSIKILKERKL